MKKQAFVLTLGVVLLSVVAGLGMLINAQGPMASSGGEEDAAKDAVSAKDRETALDR